MMQAPSQGFMSQVLAEAAEQETLTEVVSPLFDAAVQALKPPAQPLPLGQPPEDIGERHFGAARALVALFKEKPVTSAFSQRHDFFLPAEAAAPPPQLFFMPPPSPRSGPAVEANTALGAVVQQRVHAVVAGTNFANIHRGMQVQEVEAQFRQLRMPLSNMQMSQVAIFNALLRGGASPRAALLRWICEAAAANDAAGATQPDRSKVSSDGFLLNLGFVLLELSKPFLEEQTKANLIRTDTKFVAAAERHYGAFPDDLQPLSPSAADPAAAAAADGDVNFITQCFFLTWRVLHLGLVSQLARHENLLRHINRIHHQSADPANDLQLSRFMQQQFGTMVSRRPSMGRHIVARLAASAHITLVARPARAIGLAVPAGPALWRHGVRRHGRPVDHAPPRDSGQPRLTAPANARAFCRGSCCAHDAPRDLRAARP
mmetsp:Transcript_106145/g.307107  ORF Transcript_106145/g.307107 Transcript_106145/m.307107 type:complete len:431 (-) Transcript_106145:1336-2628(-)